MPVTFIDLAQTCAPTVAVETLAGIVSLESRFKPYAVRIGAGKSLADQPASKAEAIAAASALIAERQNVQLGLGGIGSNELGKLKLSIADALDPCLNLRATATLLDGYYRLALRAGADTSQAEKVMLQSYYGRSDPTVEAMSRYGKQVEHERKRLSGALATLTIEQGADERPDPSGITNSDKLASKSEAEQTVSETAGTPSWDVFGTGRTSVLIFQNKPAEQSE
jgi:type IV secretion system protein VirB1